MEQKGDPGVPLHLRISPSHSATLNVNQIQIPLSERKTIDFAAQESEEGSHTVAKLFQLLTDPVGFLPTFG